MALTLVLLAFTLLAASCGAGGKGSEKGTSGSGGSEVEISGQEDVDALLKELDGIIDSVDPEDFNAEQLDDSRLGL